MKEERLEKILTPTPSQDDELWKSKSHANEDGTALSPEESARIRLNGALKEFDNHLLKNRPRLSHLTDGFQDWEEYGLRNWAVERVELKGAGSVVVLSVPSVTMAKNCLAKYHQKWDEILAKWFGRRVQIGFAGPDDER